LFDNAGILILKNLYKVSSSCELSSSFLFFGPAGIRTGVMVPVVAATTGIKALSHSIPSHITYTVEKK
jgi:hypothetical protein